MKICLVAEGSYPYITGGVSSWIHSLISAIPEHDFILYTIGAEEKQSGKYKYKLPSNVIQVEEVFLDTYITEEAKWGKRYKLTSSERQALKSVLNSNETDWEDIFSLFTSGKIDTTTNLLTSKDFFDIILEICHEKYPYLPFNDMFWTLRSIVLPLFISINHPVPKADVYHSVSTGYAGVVASLAKWKHDTSFILTEHGIYTREREEEIIKSDWVKGHFKDLWIQYFQNMSNCAYKHASQVVSLYNKNKEIQIEIGCPEEKIQIISNGVSLEDFNIAGKGQPKSDDKINIGAVLRVVPIKDVKTMLQSFAIVKRDVPNAFLYIMGPAEDDEEYYEECQQLVKTLRLADVIFTGTVDVKEYIGEMHILVLSSISEGQPLAILEGMACAKPYVATNVGSCKELLLGNNDGFGEAGIVVSVMNYNEMAYALTRLARNRKLREQMGENGLNRVSALYTKEKFIQSYRDLYMRSERNDGRDRI